VFCLWAVLVRLSVPVQVIDWKDSSLVSKITYNVLMGTFETLPTHSDTHETAYFHHGSRSRNNIVS